MSVEVCNTSCMRSYSNNEKADGSSARKWQMGMWVMCREREDGRQDAFGRGGLGWHGD